ncbi:hypothetical protein [Bradyrhizobium denitrificans]|uniref:hypothetical protein n=1 Tax=Bradyrhizobium denitrificans TaxID=2734912 RepID=UPI001FE29F88|nr:hypothetical protein [Bradyrhizobium denitrificans]
MADVVDRPQAAPAEKSRPIDTPSIWHAGEMALQETVGVRRAMERQGAQVIRDHLIDQHRLFFRCCRRSSSEPSMKTVMSGRR